jgi:hypothetical protein
MKRSFPPPAREALCALVGVLVLGAACEPNQDVPPGAPVLKEFTIVVGGTTPTTITADTPDCPAGIVGGEACNPMGDPPDGLCRQASAMNWCNCVPDPMDAMASIWDCSPFTNVSAVIAVFDRLLYTPPLDPGDTSGVTDVVTTMAGAGAPQIMLVTDYSSTGAANGLIFNLYGPFFANFRGNGPSLFSAPDPEFPSGTTVTVSLQANKVLAKDGTTPFTGNGLLQGGTLVFTMAPFSAVVVAAQPFMPATADSPEMPTTPAMVAFTNFADTAGCGPPTPATDDEDPPLCTTAAHITATANGAPVAIDVASGDGSTMIVTPMGGGAWPVGATVVITVDAATTNLLGQPIAAAASETFTGFAIATP